MEGGELEKCIYTLYGMGGTKVYKIIKGDGGKERGDEYRRE